MALNLNVADNLTLTKLTGLGPWGLILPSRQERECQRWLDRFFTGGVAAVAEEWWRASNVADQTVTFEERGERMEGQAVRLDQSGALVVELADGTERVVTAGDVNLQR